MKTKNIKFKKIIEYLQSKKKKQGTIIKQIMIKNRSVKQIIGNILSKTKHKKTNKSNINNQV